VDFILDILANIAADLALVASGFGLSLLKKILGVQVPLGVLLKKS